MVDDQLHESCGVTVDVFRASEQNRQFAKCALRRWDIDLAPTGATISGTVWTTAKRSSDTRRFRQWHLNNQKVRSTGFRTKMMPLERLEWR